MVLESVLTVVDVPLIKTPLLAVPVVEAVPSKVTLALPVPDTVAAARIDIPSAVAPVPPPNPVISINPELDVTEVPLPVMITPCVPLVPLPPVPFIVMVAPPVDVTVAPELIVMPGFVIPVPSLPPVPVICTLPELEVTVALVSMETPALEEPVEPPMPVNVMAPLAVWTVDPESVTLCHKKSPSSYQPYFH